MIDRAPPVRREEIASTVTHALGLVASVVALPIVVVAAARSRDPFHIVGAAVFGASLVLLYAASTVYHALRPCSAKLVLRKIDHSAIYLLIAGTYTPFALGPLRGAWGWSILGAIWSMALLGIVLKSARGFGRPWLSTTMYVLMGWTALVAIVPLLEQIGWAGLAWLLAGGLCYTGGVIFYATDHRVRYGHALWHLFVMGGSVCHFFGVLLYAVGGAA